MLRKLNLTEENRAKDGMRGTPDDNFKPLDLAGPEACYLCILYMGITKFLLLLKLELGSKSLFFF